MKLNGIPSALSLFSAVPPGQPFSPWFTTKGSFFRSWNKLECCIVSLGCFKSGQALHSLVKSQNDDVINCRAIIRTVTIAPPSGQTGHVKLIVGNVTVAL